MLVWLRWCGCGGLAHCSKGMQPSSVVEQLGEPESEGAGVPVGLEGGQPGSRIRRAINEVGSSRFVEWTFKTSMLIHANDVVDSCIVGLSLCTLACPPLLRRASACLCLNSACFAGRGRPGTGVRGLRCFVGENAPPSSQSSSDTVMVENPSTGLIFCALMAHRDAVIEANTAAS